MLSHIPVYSLGVTFSILLFVMSLRYIVMAFGFQFLCQKFQLNPIDQLAPTKKQMIRDFKWSLASTLVFAISGTILVRLWQQGETLIYDNVSRYGWTYFFLSLPLALLIHETYFYWTHRLLHLKPFYRSVHQAHHESRVPTAWTSFAFHPLEALVQAIILPAIVILMPLHSLNGLVLLLIMSITGMLNHLGFELYPPFLERRWGIISAHHHQHHHRKYNSNFGLYVTWWDHLMGTEGARHER
jgi:lathosterol oxidase